MKILIIAVVAVFVMYVLLSAFKRAKSVMDYYKGEDGTPGMIKDSAVAAADTELSDGTRKGFLYLGVAVFVAVLLSSKVLGVVMLPPMTIVMVQAMVIGIVVLVVSAFTAKAYLWYKVE